MHSHCKNHGTLQIEDIAGDYELELDLNFVLGSVMRTMYQKPDIHVIGRDHEDRGSLNDIIELTGFMTPTLPAYFLTPLFPGLGKSSKDGARLDTLADEYGDDIIPASVLASEHIMKKSWVTVEQKTALNLIEKFAYE